MSVPGPRRIHVIQGGHQVSADRGVCLTTLLGSCVAACLWDAEAGIGGMNHFLLPEAPGGGAGDGTDRRYGVQAMELLINGLLAAGAERARLRAKVFGGGRMMAGVTDIGARNADFARRFLSHEGVPVVAASLGGSTARRIQFWPTDGRARQHRLAARAVAFEPMRPPSPEQSGELELFG